MSTKREWTETLYVNWSKVMIPPSTIHQTLTWYLPGRSSSIDWRPSKTQQHAVISHCNGLCGHHPRWNQIDPSAVILLLGLHCDIRNIIINGPTTHICNNNLYLATLIRCWLFCPGDNHTDELIPSRKRQSLEPEAHFVSSSVNSLSAKAVCH